MTTYQIISDSCCDFTAQQYHDNNVLCVPLSVIYNGQAHDNFTDDAAVLFAIYTAIKSELNEESEIKAKEKLKEWFDEYDEEEIKIS